MKAKLTKDWLLKNGNQLKKAYSYAIESNLNIKSEEDVLSILKIIDPENANLEYVRNFSKMLQLFDHIAKKKVLRRNKVN